IEDSRGRASKYFVTRDFHLNRAISSRSSCFICDSKWTNGHAKFSGSRGPTIRPQSRFAEGSLIDWVDDKGGGGCENKSQKGVVLRGKESTVLRMSCLKFLRVDVATTDEHTA